MNSNMSEFIAATLGESNGYLCIGRRDPHLPKGHKDRFKEEYFAYPAELDKALSRIEALSADYDVYFCPAVLSKPKRNDANVKSVRAISFELDKAPDNRDFFNQLPKTLVASGTEGHQHVYIPLKSDTTPASAREIARKLARVLGVRTAADGGKTEPSGFLRVPGTLNHKPDGEPAAVAVTRTSRRKTTIEALSDLLSDFHAFDDESHEHDVTGADIVPERVAKDVRRKLSDDLNRETGDRSSDIFALVSACREHGLTIGQALTLALEYPPAQDKWHNDPVKIAADVARIWVRQGDDGSPFSDPKEGEDIGSRFESEVSKEAERIKVREEARLRIANEGVEEKLSRLPEVVPLSVMLSRPQEPVQWLIEGLLREGHDILAIGLEKSGKSTVALNATRCLVTGEDFLGHKVNPIKGNIGWLNYELTEEDSREWAVKMDFPPDRLIPINLRDAELPLMHEAGQKWLADVCLAHDIQILIVDPAGAAISLAGGDESSNADVTRFWGALRQVKRMSGVSNIIMPAHAFRNLDTKTLRARGAQSWAGAADAIWFIHGEMGKQHHLTAFGRGVNVEKKVSLVFNKETLRITTPTGAASSSSSYDDQDMRVLAFIEQNPGCSGNAIDTAPNLGNSAERRAAVKRLEEAGLIEDRGVKKHLRSPKAWYATTSDGSASSSSSNAGRSNGRTPSGRSDSPDASVACSSSSSSSYLYERTTNGRTTTSGTMRKARKRDLDFTNVRRPIRRKK